MKKVAPFLLIVLLSGCLNEGDCLINATNFMHVQFKKKTNQAADTVVTFAYRSVDIPQKNMAINYQPASEILLPLDTDLQASSTTFIFHRINLDSTVVATDTLQIGYDTQAKLITKDCGAFTYYRNLKILKTNLSDSQLKLIHTNLLKDPTNSAISGYALNYQIFY